jgi:hypothetical protein
MTNDFERDRREWSRERSEFEDRMWRSFWGFVWLAITWAWRAIGVAARWIWRNLLYPLSRAWAWLAPRLDKGWQLFRLWCEKKRQEWANDLVELREWARLARLKHKDEHVLTAMATRQYSLTGRIASPLNILGWAPLIVGMIGIAFSGVVLWWNAGLRDKLDDTRADLDIAIEQKDRMTTRATQAETEYAALRDQRLGEQRQAAEEALKSAEIRADEERRRRGLAAAERRIRDEAAKAAAGGPPVDWDRELREHADPPGGAPVSPAGGAAPAGDPAA